MPSEDAKPVKEKEEENEDEEDGKSLGSIILNRDKTKKKPSNTSSKRAKVKEEEDSHENKSSGTSSKPAKVKKQEDSPEKKPSCNSSKPAKVKKEEDRGFDCDDDKPISKKSVTKDDKKKKKINKEEKTKVKVEAEDINTKKRVRKVYDLPGQKRDPPEERDPLRIFYETLYKQVPHSEMAAIWMMESGLLSVEESKKVYENKQKRNHLQGPRSPAKTVTKAEKSTQSVSVKKKVLLSSNSVSNKKKKITESTAELKKQKKRRKDESTDEDSNDEFIVSRKVVKRQKTV
ncbi:hypothetical protein Nepgr_005110 [Nepenthes gracilis]|uniref:Transcriptional regulator ATRX homolog n=1 Tax=Nepenthes gracilis TaxID=150966 RepID=A0AAD3XG83_NEPGR|nr:hypothetical protein Nepgr_005110 [Nepenthes gracilis]